MHRKFNHLKIRCGRENQHPAEGALRPLIDQLEIRPVGEKMLEWGTCPRKAGPPGPWLSSPGERERNAVMAIRVGVNMLQFCLVSNSISHSKTFSNPFESFQIKWVVYFSKRLCPLVFIASLSFCMHMCMYSVHGYTTHLIKTYNSKNYIRGEQKVLRLNLIWRCGHSWASYRILQVQQLPYLLDLGLSDFFLFPKYIYFNDKIWRYYRKYDDTAVHILKGDSKRCPKQEKNCWSIPAG